MKRLLMATLCLACAGILSGCYSSPIKPPLGLLYSQVSHPLTTDFDNTIVGDANSFHVSEKISAVYLYNLSFSFGEADVESIARQRQIEEISYAELTYTNVLGIYQETEVHIYGN